MTIKLYFGFYQLHELIKNNAFHIVDQTLIQLKKGGQRKERMKEGKTFRKTEGEGTLDSHTGRSEREIKDSQTDGQLVRHTEGQSTVETDRDSYLSSCSLIF